MLAYIIIVVAAYFLGSIPTGYLVGRAKGIDIRTVGSGNIGATNVMRALGKPVGIAVLLLDALKGYAAVAWVCPSLLKIFNGPAAGVQTLSIVAGIAAVMGHNFTCWLKFKGGKGIATSGGAYLALAPLAVGIAVAAFVLAVILTRYVSIGSIAAAVALPAAVWCLPGNHLFLRLVTTALGAMAIYKHKSNIKRLMVGTESRIGRKPEIQEATK
ncbi:MAG: glycerol-3-phosphate 1-O-acyltransferase PlsY [Limisphaerales bacterium]